MNPIYDYSDLCGVITAKFGGQRGFAKAIHRRESHVSLILNNKAYLRQTELDLWVDTLGIAQEDVGRLFLTRKVHETQQ